ncbi:ABC transporter ATP-binding protein [Latilactobacillus sakei]|uniref:AAA family ATPase n=1 Tax=Latilactobacillus sakei TaxID=1599 RepID=UPI000978AC27|nr:AAA family ATPase [Latilactobacillus sakei]GEA77562.1 ABC transporter ATP-binding protein [Latilactobacillus sakei]SOB39849.1 putative DNA-repair ATPase [Latilactobacillus sakei]
MIFKELKLINFRQFKGENKFVFPINDRKITLIIARNGVGKTTFLQAFRFCFYGESPNVLKLPKSEELLNYSVENDMSEMDEQPLTVQVKFQHNGKDYIAVRTVRFRMFNRKMQKLTKNSDDSFELWEETENRGVIKVEDGLKRIQEMIPTGLAHVYMFDGERVEKPIGSKEFKNDLKNSIVGVLGLKKLEQARDFLGDESKSSSVIGQVYSRLMPLNNTEQEILDRNNVAKRNIEKLNHEIELQQGSVEILTRDIAEATEAQKSIDELKILVQERQFADLKINKQEQKIESLTKSANDCAVDLLLKLEIAKTYPKYKEFIEKEEEQTEVFENLYESVIKDILKRHKCICGREVHSDSHEADILRSLSVLPQDNANYLNALKSLYNSITDIPILRSKVEQYHKQLVLAKKELEELRKAYDVAVEKVIEKEKTNGKNDQVNIEHLRANKARILYSIETNKKSIEDNQSVISSISLRLKKIRFNNQHNRNVNASLTMLNELKLEIEEELDNKKKIARESIENNMNLVLTEVMDQHYKVRLDSEYKLTVYKVSDNNYVQDETEVLSTGQNVMMYLSFLRALLMTIEQHSEFDDVQSSGVIMDAALSNLDEEHIKQISRRILNSFDQLIFLSFKAQLRNELITGIHNNISCVYELSKDALGNVVSRTIDTNNVEEYVNEDDDIDE